MIHIFEDEWNNSKEIIKSMISDTLGKFETVININECSVRKVNYESIKDFLTSNHLFGECYAKINYGLFHENELVSIMCISKLNDKYVILRHCNKLNTSINGTFEKLFNYFLEEYDSKHTIISCDLRYGDGSSYESFGFKLNKETEPKCFYLKNSIKRLSENQIHNESLNDFYKVYDCGSRIYEYIDSK